LQANLTDYNLSELLDPEFDVEIVKQAFAEAGDDYDKLVGAMGEPVVVRSSFKTLQPGKWLNDEIINRHAFILRNRDARLCMDDLERKKCHFFSTFFMSRALDGLDLRSKWSVSDFVYSKVARSSRRAPGMYSL